MIIAVVCAIVILYILNLSWVLRVSGALNFFDNDGSFEVKLFFITLAKGKMHFEQDDGSYGSLIIERRNHKETSVHLNYDKDDKQSVASYLDAPLFRNMLVRSVDAGVKIGKSDNAFFTTMAMAAAKSAYYAFIALLKTRQSGMSTRERFIPVYHRDELTADFEGIISISFADIIYSYLRHRRECRARNCGVTALNAKLK